MPIKLLALDLDGTLLNSRGELSERNRDAITMARSRGVDVAIVTGRRFRDARPIALELGLDIPLIAHNGALTKHARTLETVAVLPLPVSAAHRALQIGRESGVGLLVSDGVDELGVLVYDRLSENNTALKRYLAWSVRVHGEQASKSVFQVSSLEDYLDHDPIHVAFSGNYQLMKQLEETLRRELGETAKIFCTGYPKTDFALLDILHPKASKGAGVAAVAEELAVERQDVLAVGDNFNDLEMLRFAGTGVLMANAEPALRQLTGLHSPAANDEDGVALAIERFVLDVEQEGIA